MRQGRTGGAKAVVRRAWEDRKLRTASRKGFPEKAAVVEGEGKERKSERSAVTLVVLRALLSGLAALWWSTISLTKRRVCLFVVWSKAKGVRVCPGNGRSWRGGEDQLCLLSFTNDD